MGLDAQFRTINVNAEGDKRHEGTTTIATFRKFHPLQMWVKDNIPNAHVEHAHGYPIIVEAELSANDIQRAYVDIANVLGLETDMNANGSSINLTSMRNAYEYAVKHGENTPCVYYGGDC